MGATSLALLLDASLATWFGSENAWQALSFSRYLIALSCLGGLATWWLQGSRRSPAIPVCVTVVTLAVSFLLSIVLIWRVLIDPPGPGSTQAGAYLGLVFACGLTMAAYRSVRVDGIRDADGPVEIERLELALAPAPPNPAL